MNDSAPKNKFILFALEEARHRSLSFCAVKNCGRATHTKWEGIPLCYTHKRFKGMPNKLSGLILYGPDKRWGSGERSEAARKAINRSKMRK